MVLMYVLNFFILNFLIVHSSSISLVSFLVSPGGVIFTFFGDPLFLMLVSAHLSKWSPLPDFTRLLDLIFCMYQFVTSLSRGHFLHFSA